MTTSLTCKKREQSHDEGHRKRAFSRLLDVGYENLRDYEMVELMLFLMIKRKDVKPLAKELMAKFKTIDRILSADKDDLLTINGIGESVYMGIKIINEIIKASLKSKLAKQDPIACFEDVIAYCKANMKHLIAEELRVLFLSGGNKIIKDEVIATGSPDSVEISIQDILKRCIGAGAKKIILVHNHTSGDPTPSPNDITTTKMLKKSAMVLGIDVSDHIIIAGDRYVSFRALNLLL